jgi:glycosyltransferase involved in cell wall biosynthesis
MNILLINPYDYKTVQSNPGLLSLLHVLEKMQIPYAMTVAGPVAHDGFKYVEMPESLLDTENNAISQLLSRIAIDKLTHVIAIDPEGAMVAMRLRDAGGARSIRWSYISYEILFRDEIVFSREQKLKEYDLAYLRLCREVLIQDEMRGQMFNREMGADFKQFHAPVSPHRYLGRSPDRDAIKKALGIPLNRKILVYSGSLAPYAKPDWWIRIAETLPQEYIFLFTCYDSQQLKDQNLARIGRVLAALGNAFFMQKELPAAPYMQLLQACDAGIALFRPVYTHWMNGRNIRQIGLSSGKFSSYVSCGLPVICDDDQDVFRKLAAEYSVVQTISAPEEVASRLKTLSAMADKTETGCKTLFHERLDPCNGIRRYLDALG